MAYRTTLRANEDIYAIYAYGIEYFGFEQAEKYNEELFAAFEALDDLPLLGRERPEYKSRIRVQFHGSHAIYYQIESDGILIIRVLHGSRDWRRHL